NYGLRRERRPGQAAGLLPLARRAVLANGRRRELGPRGGAGVDGQLHDVGCRPSFTCKVLCWSPRQISNATVSPGCLSAITSRSPSSEASGTPSADTIRSPPSG